MRLRDYMSIFVRVDDFPRGSNAVDVPDRWDMYNRFMDAFDLPILLGVVPGLVTQEDIARIDSDERIEIAMHGVTHDLETDLNMSSETAWKGRRSFGSIFPRIYIPPHNAINLNLLMYLNTCGIHDVCTGPETKGFPGSAYFREIKPNFYGRSYEYGGEDGVISLHLTWEWASQRKAFARFRDSIKDRVKHWSEYRPPIDPECDVQNNISMPQKAFLNYVLEWLFLANESTTILDFGCGWWSFPAHMRKRGYFCRWFDRDPRAEGWQGKEHRACDGGRFEVIVAGNSIQHNANLIDGWRDCLRFAKPGTIIFVSEATGPETRWVADRADPLWITSVRDYLKIWDSLDLELRSIEFMNYVYNDDVSKQSAWWCSSKDASKLFAVLRVK